MKKVLIALILVVGTVSAAVAISNNATIIPAANAECSGSGC